jgi:hypothetical protein
LENFQLKVVSFFCSIFFLLGLGFTKIKDPESAGEEREREREGGAPGEEYFCCCMSLGMMGGLEFFWNVLVN